MFEFYDEKRYDTIEKTNGVNYGKKVKLFDGNLVSLDIDKSYCGHTFRITKRYFKNGEYVKDFCLSMWDDYGFDAWIDDVETLRNDSSISFDIPPHDPLYLCFFKFLEI